MPFSGTPNAYIWLMPCAKLAVGLTWNEGRQDYLLKEI